jgi:hypothetical protein
LAAVAAAQEQVKLERLAAQVAAVLRVLQVG